MSARPAATRLVEAYLHDLDRALPHLEVDERRDVVDSVREHIDAALAERADRPTAVDVERVLQELGPVEAIAHDADPGSTAVPDRDPRGAPDRGSWPMAASYLLAALIIGMAVTASLVTVRVPAFFRDEGGDPVAVAQLTWTFLVFTIAAFVVKRKLPK
ncbi:MAG: hypothetical protein JJT89_00220 [Nitriliruptoraceae bacterium]|nr:hypothetical protein [Nitriliruptoraceae bacterium]